MKTKEELIRYYEKQLEKVISAYGNGITNHLKERGQEYIKNAEDDLEEVKNGREW